MIYMLLRKIIRGMCTRQSKVLLLILTTFVDLALFIAGLVVSNVVFSLMCLVAVVVNIVLLSVVDTAGV